MTSSIKKQRIWVTDEITRKLCQEFETSGTTVLNALKIHSHSEMAIKIRNRAIELMDQVQVQNKELLTALGE